MNSRNSGKLNEKGLTLVELLAVSILFGIIAIFVTSLVIQSTETTKEIQIENNFRDEADLLMSNLIKAMYETKQSNVANFEDNTNNSYLQVISDSSKCTKKDDGSWDLTKTQCKDTLKKIGFVTENGNRKLYLKDIEYKVTNSNISILSDSKIKENSDGSFDIFLHLQYKNTRRGKEILQNMQFKNTIQPF